MKRKEYPAPLVIAPLGEHHIHTVIALHGRGSNAEKFGHELIASANLQTRLPTVKFIFPTASKRRSTVLKKIPINQWFDNYSLDDPGQRTDLQIDGLCESAAFIRGLITKEADLLGAGGYKKVVLWCLSQGCAAGIFSILGGSTDMSLESPLGAFVGMSGWLPFERDLQDILQLNPSNPAGDDYDDPFMKEEESEVPLPIQAIDHIREILELPAISSYRNPSMASSLWQLKTPVFLGHGAEDPKVSVHLGEKMTRVLSTGLGMNVTWNPYPGLGHWYRVEDEIEDILKFLECYVGVPLVAAASLT